MHPGRKCDPLIKQRLATNDLPHQLRYLHSHTFAHESLMAIIDNCPAVCTASHRALFFKKRN